MFNVFDVIALLMMGFGAYFGFETGIIASIFYISSGFVGMWAAQRYVPEPGLQFYVVFLAGAGVVILAGFVASKILKSVCLGMTDRVVGAFLGLLLGFAIIATVVLPLASHMKGKTQKAVCSSFTGSRMLPSLQKAFPRVKQFEMKDLKEILPLSGSSKK